MKKRFLIFGLLLVSIFLFNTETVNAISPTVDSKTTATYTGVGKEGLIRIEGREVFCIVYYQTVNVDAEYSSQNAVDYFANFGEVKAQEIVTRLALYEKYVREQDLYPLQKYYYIQALVWDALAGYYDWPVKDFAITEGSYNCTECNSSIQQDVFDGAKKYYEKNKNKYKGDGTIWYSGNHQPIGGDFSLKRVDYNYYIDSACVNCKSKNKNGAYYIQDITDWDAILNSGYSDNENVRKYYKKSNSCGGIYCREEYNVVFPNANQYINVDSEKQFNVSTGRYFTVNLSKSMISNGVANFGPIKVTKIKQCQAKNGDENCIKQNVDIGDDLGSIKLDYKETNGNTYEVSTDLVPNENRTVRESDTYVDNILTMKETKYYELSRETFRYVEKGSGKAKSNLSKSDIDLGTPTLPISFNNFAKDGNAIGAKITLSYQLPTKEKINKAFNDASYFGSQKGTENIYKKYVDEKKTNMIEQTACAKMFGYPSQEFDACASKRTSDASLECREQVNGKYVCDINVCKEGERLCSNGKCSEGKECPPDPGCPSGECPDGKNPVCRIEAGKYYDKLNNEITKEEYEKQCTCQIIEDGKYIDANGQLTTNYYDYLKQCPSKCGQKNGKYYGVYGEEVSKEEYDRICPYGEGCPPEKQVECPESTWINGNPCLRCPSGACPMPGGVCPYGGNTVIYRPIDLINPFPGQTGSSSKNRQTGSNWCTYSLTNGTIDCRGGNSNSDGNKTVETKIKNNRGVKDYSVYNKEPLYEIELDARKIKNIRGYNSKHSYDKWDLTCTSAGVCHSEFLDDIKPSGTCSRNSDLASCARGDK